MIGRTLAGKYQLLEKIREQRFYDVFAARLINTDTRYIIKIINQKYTEPQRTAAMLSPNLSVISALRHPRIACLRDFGEDPAFGLYLAEEYYEGTLLRDILRAGTNLNSLQALDLGIKIMEALGHAHGKKIAHGLLSPESVVVLGDLNVKLCDFYALAALASQPFINAPSHSARDLRYCAPESVSGITATFQADIYSAGVILYELMTGRLPFSAEQTLEIAMDKNYYEPAQPRDINPQVPLLLNSVIVKALKPRPASRYESASEFLSELLLCRSSMMRAMSAGQQQQAAWAPQPSSPPLQAPGIPLQAPPIAAIPPVLPRTAPLAAPLPSRPPEPVYQPPPRQPEAPRSYVPAGAPLHEARRIDPPRPKTLPPEGLSLDNDSLDAEHIRNKKIITIIIAATLFAILVGIMGFATVMLKNRTALFGDTMEVAVPDVVGMELPEAQAKLNELKFKIKIRTEPNKDVKKDHIIKQDPEGGQKEKEGREVTIWVSTGTEELTVPDFRRRTLADARTIAEKPDFSFRVETEEEYSEEVAKGWVIAQKPDQGTEVIVGARLTLFISKGPEPHPMPDLKGKKLNEAYKILEQNNIHAKDMVEIPTNSAGDNIVVGQSILPGALVNLKTDSVTIYVAKPVEEVLPPDDGGFGDGGDGIDIGELSPAPAPVDPVKHEHYTITVKEPGKPVVVVEVIDKNSRKVVHNQSHKSGDVFEVAVEGVGESHVNVFINGKLDQKMEF
jgi:eukaryotic-like serine/threonine-protein kinase